MKQEIKQRRVRMLSLIVKGAKEREAAEEVAKDLNQTVDAVQKDWRRRERWLPDFVNTETSTAIQEIVVSMKELLRQAWLTYANSPDGTAIKVGAYRELRQTVHDMAEIFQSVGIVMKMPEKVEITNVNETRLILEQYEQINTTIQRIQAENLRENSPQEQVYSSQANNETS